jgi:hypothetical protein
MRRPILLALAASALSPAVAQAHGLGGVAGTPVPAFAFAWAAAVVLVASFAALGALWKTPRLETEDRRRARALPASLEIVAGSAGVAAFAWLVVEGFTGTRDPDRNPLLIAVYVWFWVALVPVSALVGDVFAPLNPWRAVARAGGWVTRRTGLPLGRSLAYPAWLGRWPAAVTIAAFAWVELVWTRHDDPTTIAVLALVYAAVQLFGSGLFGVEAWSARGDGFAVYFGIFARLALLTRRPAMQRAAHLDHAPGTIALLCVMIGSTSFDGLSGTTAWRDLTPHLYRALGSTQLVGTAGLAAMIALIAIVYRLGAPRGHRQLFAHSLIPIATAYVVAHYLTFVVDLGLHATLDQTAVWLIQVGALVTGHVGGLVLAHDRAIALFPTPAVARRSQERMLTVMVAYTSLGLWLLSSLAR